MIDKAFVAIKNTPFVSEGEIVKVTEVDNDFGVILYVFGDDFKQKGLSNITEFNNYFKSLEEVEETTKTVNTITPEYIDEILSNSEIEAQTVFNKCTIVSCKLPNGFVIVEYSACVDPKNYDLELGIDICMEKIIDKVWELEGYKLQNELDEDNNVEEVDDYCDCLDCETCPYAECFEHDNEDDDNDNEDFEGEWTTDWDNSSL